MSESRLLVLILSYIFALVVDRLYNRPTIVAHFFFSYSFPGLNHLVHLVFGLRQCGRGEGAGKARGQGDSR